MFSIIIIRFVFWDKEGGSEEGGHGGAMSSAMSLSGRVMPAVDMTALSL